MRGASSQAPIKVLISGRPGVGKSTVFMRVVEGLRQSGLRVCGFYCPEIRIGGVRKGFKIVSIGLPAEGVLSYVCGEIEGLSSLTVGKYCLKVDDAISIGVRSLEYAEKECDLVVVDEVGPMELKVRELGERIWRVLYGPKPVVAVVHMRSFDEVRRALASRFPRVYSYIVLETNRDRLHEEILRDILASWRRS